jgi:cell wall-associated NlpC family hydrolase
MPRSRLVPAALVAVLAVVLGLAVTGAGADPTRVPTNADEARASARHAAAQVAHLQKTVRAQYHAVASARAAADRAAAEYHRQLSVLKTARLAAQQAQVAAVRAQAAYENTETRLGTLLALQYQSGGAAADAADLLIADDPTQMLTIADAQAQLGRYSADLVDDAQVARDASDAANAARQNTLLDVQQATVAVRTARDKAAVQYAKAQRGLVRLRADLGKAQTSQQVAESVLSMFIGGWAMADPAEAAALNATYAAIAARYRHEPLAGRSDRWTSGMANSAVHRALQYLGTPYAWAGGNGSGPTHGVCAAGAAHNDCHLTGFDCSGLVLYGWAPYKSMAHYAATQWGYGRVHPAPSQLRPGDLLFWSSNGTAAGIHHVAMYVGDGNVIQAPQSGDVVRITPMGNVSSGYFGATRPLT